MDCAHTDFDGRITPLALQIGRHVLFSPRWASLRGVLRALDLELGGKPDTAINTATQARS
jgi:hypothetical protein